MKKILINARFLTKPISGVERYARNLVRALTEVKQNQYNFVLLTHHGKLIDPPVNIKIIQDNSILTGHLWEQVRLPYLARKYKADVLWSPCNVGPVFAKKHIVTIHDASVFAGPQWFSKRFRMLYGVLLPILGRRAKKIITDSNFSKGELIKYRVTYEEKLQVLPGGMCDSFFVLNTPSSKKVFSFRYVLAMGSGNPRKNVTMLVSAWKQLSVKIKRDRKLVILGGESRAFSPDLLDSVPDDVYCPGFVDDKDLPVLYAGADSFVYPSLYEGFGLPPLEAMACGCPVVVSDAASLPEVCGDAAYYVDPYSVKSIAEGMYKVLSDGDLRQDLIKKGFERVKLFRWERTAKETLKVFAENINTEKGES